jgi:hypothetical protein
LKAVLAGRHKKVAVRADFSPDSFSRQPLCRIENGMHSQLNSEKVLRPRSIQSLEQCNEYVRAEKSC